MRLSRHAASAPRALVWATLAVVFLLMTLGNIVSATGSGLACPDWPLCHGRLIPPLEPDILIEYGHRLAAALASVLLVATIILTIRRGSAGGTRRIGIVLLALLGVQIGLGGVTVLLKLPQLVSTAHLVNALLIFGGLVILSFAPTAREGQGSGAPSVAGKSSAPLPATPLRRLVMVGLAVLLAQLALGGYVRHSGAGLACPDFPLCSGDLLPGHWLALVHWGHRWLGVALLGLFVHLALAGRRTVVATASWIAAALAVSQVALGILTVLLRLEPPVRATHAVVGYALWGVLVWISLSTGAWQAVLAGSGRSREGLSEVARVS